MCIFVYKMHKVILNIPYYIPEPNVTVLSDWGFQVLGFQFATQYKRNVFNFIAL